MSEPRWEALGKKIEPPWGPERERSAVDAIEHRAARRRTVTRVGASAAALALVAVAFGAFMGRRAQPSHESASVASTAFPLPAVTTLTITHLSPETVLDALPDRGGRAFALRSGGARFAVPHDIDHPFVVVVGDVIIEDLGTTFTVEFLAAEMLAVAVEEGHVWVRTRGESTELTAGERRHFSLGPSTPPLGKSRRTTAESAPSAWRPLAESGRYEEAHSALRKAGPNAVRDDTGDLLLAADAARLSGFPAEAVPYLERVVRAHATDPRSNLASFTLGRVLLDELGRPREAADAFARARAAGGPLAEDALARQVEATSRAGDPTKSRELAREYQKLYPNGRRAKAVSRFGGLD
ncbi:MAG TPA: FecR domain-containing protein [Polyangiaceae bacterium]